MDTFRSGKRSPFESVEFSLYRFLSSFSKSKKYFDSAQTFVVADAEFDFTRVEFALHLSCFLPEDLYACTLVYKIKTNAFSLLSWVYNFR